MWLAPPHPCSCTGSALDTPECTAPDCELRNLLILDADGTVIEGLVRTSKAAGTTSMVGGHFAANISTWRIDDSTGEYVQEQGGKATRLTAECQGDALSRSKGPPFVRADASVRGQALGKDGMPDKP